MKILLLGLGAEATGNATTLRRIAAHLQDIGHTTAFKEIEGLDEDAIAMIAREEHYDAALGVHAYGAGRFLRHLAIPTVIVFGGTDLNELVSEQSKMNVMTQAVEKAYALVCFNEDFLGRAGNLWPHLRPKLHCIPQSVEVSPSQFSKASIATIPKDAIIYLLPAGLREVKDPLFLGSIIAQWHMRDPRIHLLIVGAKRDPAYAKSMLTKAQEFPGVLLIDTLPQADLWALMCESQAVLNTSKSESSPNSLLEAMALGVPVLARDIPGNRAVIQHRKTGLLFDSPDDFLTNAMMLLEDANLRNTLIQNAKNIIDEEFAPAREASAYQALFNSMSQ